MAKEQNTSPDSLAYASKLDAIKDIIFGQEKAELSQELDKLREQAAQQDAALAKRIEMMENYFNQRLQALEENIVQRMEEQKNWIQQEINRIDNEKAHRVALGTMLIAMGEQLVNSPQR